MKPVYQTVVDPNIGNCMQAVVASMFELPLNKVPNFIESAQWALDLYTFFEDRNYDLCCWQPYTEDTLKTVYKKVAKSLTINGALYVAVPSSLYKEGLHAVLINNRGVVIHDPNPNKHWLGKDVIASRDIKMLYNVYSL